MHDPLQIFAYLDAQQRVREQSGTAPGRPTQRRARTKSRQREVRFRVARWLRQLADHLEPMEARNTVRVRA